MNREYGFDRVVQWLEPRLLASVLLGFLIAGSGVFVLLVERVVSVVILILSGMSPARAGKLYRASLQTQEFVLVSFFTGVLFFVAACSLGLWTVCSWHLSDD